MHLQMTLPMFMTQKVFGAPGAIITQFRTSSLIASHGNRDVADRNPAIAHPLRNVGGTARMFPLAFRTGLYIRDNSLDTRSPIPEADRPFLLTEPN